MLFTPTMQECYILGPIAFASKGLGYSSSTQANERNVTFREQEPTSSVQTQTRKSERTLVERFDLDNRCAVVAADPKCTGVLRIVNINAADVGRAR